MVPRRCFGLRGLSSQCLLVVLPLLACASGPQTQADRLRETLEALTEAHQRDEMFAVRLNPAPCDCPEWEVRLDGVWYRVFLEPQGGPAEALRTALLDAEGRPLPRVAMVQGRLSTSLRMSANRTQCLVLKVFNPCLEGECGPTP